MIEPHRPVTGSHMALPLTSNHVSLQMSPSQRLAMTTTLDKQSPSQPQLIYLSCLFFFTALVTTRHRCFCLLMCVSHPSPYTLYNQNGSSLEPDFILFPADVPRIWRALGTQQAAGNTCERTECVTGSGALGGRSLKLSRNLGLILCLINRPWERLMNDPTTFQKDHPGC